MAIKKLEHPESNQGLSGELAQFCNPQSPKPKRMIAAQGLVPLSPPDLATALYHLSFDSDGTVATTAKKSLESLPDEVLKAAMSSDDVSAHVLDHFAEIHRKNNVAVESIITNGNTADYTINRITRSVRDDRLLELVAVNEQRLLRSPEIIEGFYLNKHARMSTAERLVELAARNGVELNNIKAYQEAVASIKGELIPEASETPTPDDTLFTDTLTLGGVEDDFDDFEDEEEFDDDLLAEMEIDGLGEDEEEEGDLQNSISKMTVSQKVRLAQIGTAGHRSILIRDTNKLVYESVIKSPAITLQEVMKYSTNRSLAEEVIKYISNNRDWIRLYSIKVNLVNNPKTPMPKALHFLAHLRDKDLKQVSSNKNIPQAVATAAKNMVKRKQG